MSIEALEFVIIRIRTTEHIIKLLIYLNGGKKKAYEITMLFVCVSLCVCLCVCVHISN